MILVNYLIKINKMNKQELIDFENEVVERFNDGQLKSPVHLSGSIDGSLEDYLIELFKEVKKEDWLFTVYRSHYHALLKGMPRERLLQWIKDGRSIHVMDKENKIFTTAIVGGHLSIALGTALAIKIKGGKEKVWVFCGDMTSQTGIFHECFKYATNNKLPIKFIIENNFLSTDTDTAEAWGTTKEKMIEHFEKMKNKYPEYFDYVTYERKWPHYGSGKWISKIWDEIEIDETKDKGF